MRILMLSMVGLVILGGASFWGICYLTYRGPFAPTTYEECVLVNLKNTKDKMTASIIAGTCRSKFPVKYINLPPEAVDRLNGEANLTSGGYFSVEIYNGNPDWRIENIEFHIWRDKESVAKLYSDDCSISPLTTATCSFDTMEIPGGTWLWGFSNVRGKKVQ